MTITLRGTTQFSDESPRDMEYLNTNRCAWIDEDGEQCEAMIRKTSTHCQVHAAMVREALRWDRAKIDVPDNLELICPPEMAKHWPEETRAVFRAAIVRNLARRKRRKIHPLVAAVWRELTE